MINIIDKDKEPKLLAELASEIIPPQKIGYVVCRRQNLLILPAIDTKSKFLLQLGNVEGADVHMETSYVSVGGKLFWILVIEWTGLKKQKRLIFDVYPNKYWLALLSNIRMLGLTSDDFSKVITVSDIPTDALKTALHLAEVFPNDLKGDDTWQTN